MLANTLGLLALAVANAAEQKPSSNDEVFVYGQYVFDLGRMIESYIPGFPKAITGCSTEELICFTTPKDGGVLSIALPKKCQPLKVGDVWSTEVVTTRVIEAVDYKPSGHLPVPPRGPGYGSFILKSDGFDTLYVYNVEEGVTQIAFGPALAKIYAKPLQDYVGSLLFSPRVTFGGFGICQP